jgi:hypothetical protein
MTAPFLRAIRVDKDLSSFVEFLLTFTWFEYALKQAGYLRDGRDAKADWKRFADCINGDLESEIGKRPRLGQAVKYLKEFPPGRQTVKKADGIRTLDWSSIPPKENEARTLTGYVCVIRNNLFHGGKVPFDPARDTKLMKNAITILEHLLELNAATKVREFYGLGRLSWSTNHIRSSSSVPAR